jgi:Heterokaryon incompatibility protein (HET)
MPLWETCSQLKLAQRLEGLKGWFQTCCQDHQICTEVKEKLQKRSPTRLIDITGRVPRLVCLLTDAKVSYAVLSHCWGRGQVVKTTSKTLESYTFAIPLENMPKTFQDAILVTKELGIPYIWIDSLCIIQDDPQDWEQEAARMALVYEMANMTIAAAWGANGGSGCFHDHTRSLFLVVKERPGGKIYFRPYPNVRRYLGAAHLNSRAWTLQENILAQRTVIFAEDQWYWVCSTIFQSEDQLISSDNIREGYVPIPMLG